MALSNSAMQKKEKAAGFNYNPHGFLADHTLRATLPPSAFLLDCMHLYWSNGVVSWEVVKSFEHWQKSKLEGDLEGFLELPWQTHSIENATPSFRKKMGHNSNFTGSSYAGKASNLQMFLPLFHYFLERTVGTREVMQKELESMRALRRVTMSLRNLSHEPSANEIDIFQDLQVNHHKLAGAAFGSSFIKPKHHFRFHTVLQWKKFGVYADTFACEKKHKMYKSHIGLHRFDPWAQDETGKFSHLTLRAVWQHHVASLEKFDFLDGLLGKESVPDELSQILPGRICKSASKMQHAGRTICAGDVLLGDHPGVVLAGVMCDSSMFVLLKPLHLQERNEFTSRWTPGQNKKLLPANMAGRSPTWWLYLEEGSLLCLH